MTQICSSGGVAHLAGLRVELLAIAELAAQSRADPQPVRRVDRKVANAQSWRLRGHREPSSEKNAAGARKEYRCVA
jgi:hypothetical protein